MESSSYVDLFATKGGEYILVIGFLAALVLFWRMLNAKPAALPQVSSAQSRPPILEGWFQILEGFFYHRGHSWVAPEDKEIVTVGIDDFAQKLVGRMGSIHLPRLGQHIHQGATAWELVVDSKTIPMRSPVSGQVVAINEDVERSPHLVNKDPYGKGWLFKVRGPRISGELAHLFSGNLARAWIAGTEDALRAKFRGSAGVVLQDGGVPVFGIAKSLSEDKWDEIVAEFFMAGSHVDSQQSTKITPTRS